MGRQAFAKRDGNVEGYTSNDQYLADELKRLDLLIELKLLDKRKLAKGGPFEQFKGLVISEEEVAELLSELLPPLKDPVRHNELLQLEQLLAWRERNTPESCFLGLHRLGRIFGLTPFEKDCLLICLAPEIDGKYEKLFAYIQDDVTKKYPTDRLDRPAPRRVFRGSPATTGGIQPTCPTFQIQTALPDSSPRDPIPFPHLEAG